MTTLTKLLLFLLRVSILFQLFIIIEATRYFSSLNHDNNHNDVLFSSHTFYPRIRYHGLASFIPHQQRETINQSILLNPKNTPTVRLDTKPTILNIDYYYRRRRRKRKIMMNTSLYAKESFKNFEDFLYNLQQSNINALAAVTFYSPFCGPCKRLKDELASVKATLGGLITMVSIDSNKYPSLPCRYNITGETQNKDYLFL